MFGRMSASSPPSASPLRLLVVLSLSALCLATPVLAQGSGEASQAEPPPPEASPGEAEPPPADTAPPSLETRIRDALGLRSPAAQVDDGARQVPPEEGAKAAGRGGLLTRSILEPTFWRELGNRTLASLDDLLLRLLNALLVLAIFYAVYRLVYGLLAGVLDRTGADPGVRYILGQLTRYGLLAVAVLSALGQVGIEVGSLLAGLGILGLAVGLAAQDSLANLIAGITILWDRPFRVGDNVTVAGTFGEVREIGLRSTRILTVEQLDAILPNREVINQKIVNHTRNPRLRLGVSVAIAYREDTREAREVILEKVRGHELIREEPAPEVVVRELADSGVNLELRVWLIDPYDERKALFALTELAKLALDEAGIEIPFPQVTLHYGSGTFPVAVHEDGEGGEAG